MKIHGIDDSGKVTEYDHSPVSEERNWKITSKVIQK